MKTKEEMLKTLEKNYYKVQKREFEVYDNNTKRQAAFNKIVKSEEATRVQGQKAGVQNEKSEKTLQKNNLQEFKKNFDVKKADIELLKKENKQLLKDTLQNNKEVKDVEVARIKKELDRVNKENEDKVAEVLAQFDADNEALDKRVDVLKEKLKKDNKSFTAKQKDLQAKHEQVVSELQEKEAIKIDKLTDACVEQIAAIEEEIKLEEEKHNRNVEMKKAVYDEELEEINEKLGVAETEYKAKYDQIKTSSEQRIKVREKHLQRAEADKDNRSAKAHKKDIQKIQKEMDRDLNLLTKSFESTNAVSLDYRQKFKIDHLEDMTKLECAFIEYREGKKAEIKTLQVTLENNVKQAKLEYEGLQVDALESYHTEYKETKDKQLDFELETNQNLQTEATEKAFLKVRFDEDNEVLKEVLKQSIENYQKELRDVEIVKEKADFEAKHLLDEVVAKGDTDLTNAKLTFDYSGQKDQYRQNRVFHTIEFDRHESYKVELLSIENALQNRFIARQEDMVNYEILECENRSGLQVTYLETQIKQLDKDYATLQKQAKATYTLDKAFYEKEAKKLTGSLDEELATYLEAKDEELKEMTEKFDAMHPRKEKKQKRALGESIESFKADMAKTKQAKEQEINEIAKTYKTALDANQGRYDLALQEMEAFYNAELSNLQNQIAKVNEDKTQTLDALNARLDATKEHAEYYQINAQSRADKHSADNKLYLDTVTEKENNMISLLTQNYNQDTEAELNRYETQVSELKHVKETALAGFQARLDTESKNLSDAQIASTKTIDQLHIEATNRIDQLKQKDKEANNELAQKASQEKSTLASELDERKDQHNDHRNVITKNSNESTSKLETELKRIEREQTDKIKLEIGKSNSQLKEAIASLK